MTFYIYEHLSVLRLLKKKLHYTFMFVNYILYIVYVCKKFISCVLLGNYTRIFTDTAIF